MRPFDPLRGCLKSRIRPNNKAEIGLKAVRTLELSEHFKPISNTKVAILKWDFKQAFT
jgi:hypothetical protein